jgi:hypothetical protein
MMSKSSCCDAMDNVPSRSQGSSSVESARPVCIS